MADNSKIEWTDSTWNIVTGCSVISPGCTNCYAMRLAGTRMKFTPSRKGLTDDSKAGPVWNGQVRFNEEWLTQPLHWKKPRKVFVCAHADLFHEAVPDEWIDRVFAVMALCPQHSFQVLTKRAKRMREYLLARNGMGNAAICRAINAIPAKLGNRHGALKMPLPNAWLGVSCEDQARADERIPELLATPAAVRFISAEPLLGAIDLTPKASIIYQRLSEWYGPDGFDETGSQPRQERRLGWFPRIDWCIAGGESGPGARPMHPEWARSLRDQCQAAGVPFFFKQWGEFAPHRAAGIYPAAAERLDYTDGTCLIRTGKKTAGRLLDGRSWDEMPACATC